MQLKRYVYRGFEVQIGVQQRGKFAWGQCVTKVDMEHLTLRFDNKRMDMEIPVFYRRDIIPTSEQKLKAESTVHIIISKGLWPTRQDAKV